MRAVLTSENPGELTPFRQTVASLGIECASDDCVSFENLTPRLEGEPAADLVMVFEAEDQASTLLAVRSASNIGNRVVAVTSPGQHFERLLLHAGALECLRRDNLKAELSAVLERLKREGVVEAHRGQVIAVTAASAGVGVTTVASNLAFALAAAKAGRVLLAELGNGVPEIALSLDMDIRHGLDQLAGSWHRSDSYMLRQTAVEHPGGIHVLAHSPESAAPTVLAPEAMMQLLGLARAAYDYVVIDLGCSLYPAAIEALKLATAAVFVVRPDVPSLRLSANYLRDLRNSGAHVDHLHLVLNRTGHRQQVDRTEIESALHLKAIELIPDDPATTIASINEGQPLLQYSRRARITRSFDQLAQRFLTVPATT